VSQEWRRKQYYNPRVLIDTGQVLDPQFDDTWVCLTGAELEMLRNLTQYLHRRSTFVSEYKQAHYLAPTNEEWDTLQSLVSNLEEKLMGCEELLAELRAISRAIRGISGPSSITPGLVDAFIGTGELQYIDNYGTQTVVGDAKRCATAQLCFAFAYEVITEIFQPIQEKATDVMIPVAMVAIASWIGTPAIGIPVGIILATCWAAVEAWEESQLVNVVNGLLSAKDDLVCAVFNGLTVDAQAAHALAADVIDTLPAWSPIDQALGYLLYSPWVIDRMALAYTNATAWAVLNVTAGYCDDCPEYIIGNDWYAKPVLAEAGTHYVEHTENPGWDFVCHDFAVGEGEIFCGMVFSVEDVVGDCDFKRMTAYDAECTDRESAFPNCSEDLGEDDYFSVNGEEIDEANCKAVLCPGYTDLAGTLRIVGEEDSAGGWHFGWSCTGTLTLVVKYIVFEGEPPS